jgi:hypothetical protein
VTILWAVRQSMSDGGSLGAEQMQQFHRPGQDEDGRGSVRGRPVCRVRNGFGQYTAHQLSQHQERKCHANFA